MPREQQSQPGERPFAVAAAQLGLAALLPFGAVAWSWSASADHALLLGLLAAAAWSLLCARLLVAGMRRNTWAFSSAGAHGFLAGAAAALAASLASEGVPAPWRCVSLVLPYVGVALAAIALSLHDQSYEQDGAKAGARRSG